MDPRPPRDFSSYRSAARSAARFAIRPAGQNDLPSIVQLINSHAYLHRHLDWRDTLEWLGRQPFYLLEENRQFTAALACPPEPEDVAWVRLFAVQANASPDRAWGLLFGSALEALRALPRPPVVVSLALRDWFSELMLRSGFSLHQEIVVFLYDQEPPPSVPLDTGFLLRDISPGDLPAVQVIDGLAFEPIWRLSKDDLAFAYAKSTYSTLIEHNGEIIAYQMSSHTGMYAHLARLAVHPGLQRKHLGYALVQDLLEHFLNTGRCWGVTLNTQNDNAASIALYNRIGFRETGERFPVMVYSI